jgi:hypothetical protein
MLTHWLWLQALGWMAVCCTHMARVFTSSMPRITTKKKERRAFVFNILLTMFLSGVVIGVTVGVAVGVSDGKSTGYGGALCFLDTTTIPHLVLAFALPLAVVLLTNLICFVFTAVFIARVRRL